MSRFCAHNSLLIAFVGVSALSLPACSSKFSDCASSRSCESPGGSGGRGASETDQAGDSSESEPPQVAGRGGVAAGASSGGASVGGANDGGTAGDAAVQIDDAGAGGTLTTTAGSSSNGGGGGGPIAGAGPVDTVPPTILSITPINGATKLTPATDLIVITFSEPMDKPSAESAYVSTDNTSPAAFSWNAAATELSIDPHATYPTATDPTGTAAPFKFRITTGAKDLAGNALVADVNWQFTLLREITQAFGYSSGGHFAPGPGFGSFAEAGDTKDNAAIRGFMTYDISALPSGIVAIESATINTSIAGIAGDPFGKFGDLLLQSVSFSNVNQTAFDSPPIRDLGTFIAATGYNAVNDQVSKDVLAALQQDYAERAVRDDKSQYRLLFPSSPNSDEAEQSIYVSTGKNRNQLIVKYLFE